MNLATSATICAVILAPVLAWSAPLSREQAIALGGHPSVFAEFASQPYVYLLRDHEFRWEVGSWSVRDHEVIAITNLSGRDRASMQFVQHESIKFSVKGATIAPNNVRLELGKEGLKTKRLGHFVEYTVLFPNVAAGSILDLEIETRAAWTATYDEYMIASDQPVLHAKVTGKGDLDVVMLVSNIRPEHRLQRSAANVEVGEDLWFEFFDVDPFPQEPQSPPPALYCPRLMSYARNGKNWNWMAADEEPFFRAACDLEQNAEADRILKERVGNEKDPAQVCRRISSFVRDEIQVVGSGSDFGLYPQSAATTLEGRTGTAMDVAGVAVGLLRKAGLEVRLGLVRGRSRGDWLGSVYKGSQFDRFLPYVRIGAGWTWFDPIDRACGLGDLDSEYCGTTAILFRADVDKEIDRIANNARNAESLDEWTKVMQGGIHNAQWTDIVEVCTLPEWVESPESIERLTLRVADDGTMHGEMDWELTAGEKLDVRSAILAAGVQKQQDWVLSKLQARFQEAELVEHALAGLDPSFATAHATDTLRVRAKFTVANFLNGDRFRLPASVFANAPQNLFGSSTRRDPVWIDRPRCHRVEVVIEVPAGYRCTSKPEPIQADLGLVRCRVQCEGFAEAMTYANYVNTVAWRRVAIQAEAVGEIRSAYSTLVQKLSRPVEFAKVAAAK